jgi:hypothetical protein
VLCAANLLVRVRCPQTADTVGFLAWFVLAKPGIWVSCAANLLVRVLVRFLTCYLVTPSRRRAFNIPSCSSRIAVVFD